MRTIVKFNAMERATDKVPIVLFTLVLTVVCCRWGFLLQFNKKSINVFTQPQQNVKTSLQTVLCRSHCGYDKSIRVSGDKRRKLAMNDGNMNSDNDDTTDCVSYTTPIDICYQPSNLFPSDPSWGQTSIILDDIVEIPGATKSTNGTMEVTSNEKATVLIYRQFYKSMDDCIATSTKKHTVLSSIQKVAPQLPQRRIQQLFLKPKQRSTSNKEIANDENTFVGVTRHGGDDEFYLPLKECIGPFGFPRPWGTLSILES